VIRFDIDLSVAERSADGEGTAFAATVSAAGSEVVVTVDDASRLPRPAGRRALRELAPLAEDLAKRGVSVRVEGPEGTLVVFGAVKANAVQRLVTGSQHVAIGSPAAIARLGRGEQLADVALPPSTLLPIAPTLARRIRRRPTTTHATPGAGRPRLVFAVGTGAWTPAVPYEFDLLPERTTIGSSEDADLRLEGLDPIHAEIEHRGDDEYVLHARGLVGGGSAPRGDEPRPRVLRTGARIEMGPWRLAYVREEYADHGRPFGGRQGGEFEFQRRQPPRPADRPGGDETASGGTAATRPRSEHH